jgi:hypothetical protein
VNNLPEEYRPLSPWTYFGLDILYGIPIVGWIFLIIHAVGAGNVNRRNFARSFFCVYVVIIIAVIVCALAGVNYSDLLHSAATPA